jgi:hypothetical protein
MILLGVLIYAFEAYRDTDLTDPRKNVTAMAERSEGIAAPPIQFEEIAKSRGLVMRHGPGSRRRLLTEDTGSGLAWGDIDNDGDWDLYLVNFPSDPAAEPTPDDWNRLFRNDGDRFVDITEQAGVADASGFGMGACFVDLDSDGDQDLYVTNAGANRLFENLDGSHFQEVAEERGLADDAWSTGVACGDFDRDGHVDLYVCNYVDYEGIDELAGQAATSLMGSTTVPFTLNPNSFDPVHNRLFRNRGDGTFEDVAEELGVSDSTGRSLACTFCDFDGDGWLDLYINNDVSTNRLFRNMGSSREPGEPFPKFRDLSTLSGTADPRGSMGLSVGETGFMNGQWDGLPDLFITHWIAQENALYQSVQMSNDMLLFLDKTREFRLGEKSLNTVGWGCAFADIDLDGRQDIVVVNGSTLEDKADLSRLQPQQPFVFWNAGTRYLEIAAQAGPALSEPYSARGLAAADFDDDGDIDFAVSINRGQPLLLRNDTATTNRSLRIRLRGSPSVSFGARIEVQIGDRRQLAWWGCDASFLSMHAPEQIIGLGSAEQVDRVEVRWSDGTKSVRTAVAPGRLEVTHGS